MGASSIISSDDGSAGMKTWCQSRTAAVPLLLAPARALGPSEEEEEEEEEDACKHSIDRSAHTLRHSFSRLSDTTNMRFSASRALSSFINPATPNVSKSGSKGAERLMLLQRQLLPPLGSAAFVRAPAPELAQPPREETWAQERRNSHSRCSCS